MERSGIAYQVRRKAIMHKALMISRFIAGAIFIWMGTSKLGAPQDFLKAINTYEILPTTPPQVINLAAITIPWIETLGGIALLINRLRKPAALTLSCFLAIFTAAILFRTQTIMATTSISFSEVSFDCGCGSGEVLIWKKTLQNTALLFVTAFCTKSWRKLSSTRPTAQN